jgi:hypothetical protein
MMDKKTRGLLAMVVAGLIGGAVLGCGREPVAEQTGAVTTESRVELRIDFGSAGMPLIPDTITTSAAVKAYVPPASQSVYQIDIHKTLTQTSMEELATVLGMGGSIAWGPQSFTSAEYTVDFPRGDAAECFSLTKKSGIDQYMRIIDEHGEVPAGPSEDEAVKAANAYLDKLGMRQGLDQEGVAVQDSITSGSPSIKYDLTQVVSYRAKLDGLPLYGPGAKVSVTVGPGDEVLRVNHFVVAAVAGPSATLRDPSLALTDIAAGKGVPPASMTPESVKTLAITGVSLAYWAEPTPMREKYYKPVYVFTVRGSTGDSGKWIVSAFEETSTSK